MEKCKFCEEVIKKRLQNREPPFDILSDEAYEIQKKNFKVRDAECYCRGYPVCRIHFDTLKKDNKYRNKKGIDIPQSLEIKHSISADI